MAVKAKKLPVAAIRRVVVMVVVLVVHCQLPKTLAAELTATMAADPGKELEGFLPVTIFILLKIAHL